MGKNLVIANDNKFIDWLAEIKQLVKSSQLKAAVRVNTEMLHLYWNIGREIVVQQAEAVWGTGFYNTMSSSLKAEFPGVEGFSVTNLKYMKTFICFMRMQIVNSLLTI